jgi:hypothetical protein
MSEHPTELDLELLRTGEAEEEVRRHVDACDACRQRLAALETLARRIVRPLEAVPVPQDLDERLAAAARERGAAVRRKLHERKRADRRLRVLRTAIPWAAAACVVLGLAMLFALRSSRQARTGPAAPPPAPPAPVVVAAGPDDVNRDGRVDVVDAYAVALAAERGRASAEWDRTGDGRVDRSDAERIVASVVAVGRGGRP